MYVVPPLITDRKPAVLGHPRQRPLHHPPVPAQLLGALYLLPGYAPLDASFPERPRALFVVVGFVGVKLLGTLSRSATRGLPPLGLDGSGGKSGSTISQSSSLTNSLAILSTYPDRGVLKGSLSLRATEQQPLVPNPEQAPCPVSKTFVLMQYQARLE